LFRAPFDPTGPEDRKKWKKKKQLAAK